MILIPTKKHLIKSVKKTQAKNPRMTMSNFLQPRRIEPLQEKKIVRVTLLSLFSKVSKYLKGISFGQFKYTQDIDFAKHYPIG